MKNGLIEENGELIYYENGRPKHAGVVKIDGSIYYISSGGRAIRGQHIVHGEMTNGILKKGTYTFGSDCKLVKGSYIPPKRGSTKGGKLSKKQKWGIVAVCAVVFLILLVVVSFVEKSITVSHPDTTSHSRNPGSQIISLPTFEEDVILCSSAALQLYDNTISVDTAKSYGDPYRAMSFPYDTGDLTGVLLVSEHEDMSNPREFTLVPGRTNLEIHNLKTGTTYYYQATVEDQVFTGSFRTARSTRFVRIPGVENTRDIGGYTTLDGKTVRQGLLIRGTEIDGLVNTPYYLTPEDAAEIQKVFGFVCDFDLRAATTFFGNYQSPLGAGVAHKFYGSPSYGEIFREESLPALQAIFRDLANPDNYPMYLHCTWGADRTGTIVFLLQGILNMPEEDMIREYHMTGFDHSGYDDSNAIEVIVGGLSSFEGDTLQDRIITYLTTVVGVTDAEIESIRHIFLED